MNKKVLQSLIALFFVLFFGTSVAFADSLVFKADLSGAEEVPPIVSEASGSAKFRVDPGLTKIVVDLDIRNGTDILAIAGAHIHCAVAGANGPVAAFLAGAVPGGLDGNISLRLTIDDDNIIDDVCGATVAELVAAFASGDAYVNVHSAANPGGEVRGQIYQAGKKNK